VCCTPFLIDVMDCLHRRALGQGLILTSIFVIFVRSMLGPSDWRKLICVRCAKNVSEVWRMETRVRAVCNNQIEVASQHRAMTDGQIALTTAVTNWNTAMP